jgi:TrmH family RNA methyltransferase
MLQTGAELTSLRSPRIKAARQLAKRAFRQRAREFLAEGPQAVGEALAAGGVVTQLFVTAAAQARYASLIGLAAGQGADVHAVSGEVMTELAQTITPQGVLAVCRFIDVPLDQLSAESAGGSGSHPPGLFPGEAGRAEGVFPPSRESAGGSGGRPPGPILALAVVLANVRDPGNAGTVLRTADAAGAGGVIFAGSSVDPYNSKCVRASAGSLFHLPVVTGPPVADAVRALRERGLRVLAADGGAGTTLDDLHPAGLLNQPTAWLFGNEAWGLPSDVLDLADDVVAVPIYGRAESLNLAAAAAVCLYASARAQVPSARAGGLRQT